MEGASAATLVVMVLLSGALLLMWDATRDPACRYCEHCRRQQRDREERQSRERHERFHTYSTPSASECNDPKCRGR